MIKFGEIKLIGFYDILTKRLFKLEKPEPLWWVKTEPKESDPTGWKENPDDYYHIKPDNK